MKEILHSPLLVLIVFTLLLVQLPLHATAMIVSLFAFMMLIWY